MDLVYQRAHTCIGLMSTRWEQRHLDALLSDHRMPQNVHSFLRLRGARPIPREHPSPQLLRQNKFEAVGCLVADPWNTRAWILQEAFISGPKMLLLFPRVGDVKITGWGLICHEKSLSEVAISIVILREVLEQFARSNPGRLPASASTSDPTISRLSEDIKFFFPRRTMDFGSRLRIGDFASDRTPCHAATALSFLKRRNLQRVADRVAILANMCGYERRLDTSKLEQNQYNLSNCLLALAVINGDMSLLVPEMYKTPPASSLGQSCNINLTCYTIL